VGEEKHTEERENRTKASAMTTKMLCSDWKRCRWRGLESEMLRAVHPFDPTSEVTACPRCREIGGCMQACEVQDCWNEANCGVGTPDGYKRVCGNHFAQLSAGAA
jgi:hypothetical protein